MADWRRLGVGLAIVATVLGGCGRQGGNLAAPAVQAIAFEPQSGVTASADAQLIDMGNTLELGLNGRGFQPGGTYSVLPLLAYRPGGPAFISRADDVLPEAMPALADGRVQLLTSFQLRGGDRPWVGFGVFYHPNGDLGDEGNAQLVLFGPMPSDL